MQKRKKRKPIDVGKPIERPSMPLTVFVRMFLVGSVAVGASAYAIYRHYAVPRPSMLMLVPPSESSDPGLLPVPEIVPIPPDR